MCRAERWTRTRRGARQSLGVRCIGRSTFVLTPPDVLDAAAGMLLIEAVADLAPTQPRVVIDLTGIDVGDLSNAARLLARLEALAQGSGGRLRAVRADSHADGGELQGLDLIGHDAADVIDHDLERALHSATRSAAPV
jgi:anti-anti-sigma regulatory factor